MPDGPIPPAPPPSPRDGPPSRLPPPSAGLPPPPPLASARTRGIGYQGMHGTPPYLPPATGARTAIGILMWATVAATVLAAGAAFSRKQTWDSFIEGNKRIRDLDDADTLLGLAAWLVIALTLATAIVLAVWASRTVGNAQSRGRDVKPGLAAGGWFIPIGWFWVPHGQLRKAMGGRRDDTSLNWWQGLWITAVVVSNIGLRAFSNIDVDDSSDEVSDMLRNQSIMLLVGAALLSGAAYFAIRAMRNIDAATSGEA